MDKLDNKQKTTLLNLLEAASKGLGIKEQDAFNHLAEIHDSITRSIEQEGA